ncbi:TNF receptor-associated factor 4 isoform X2 [Oopsacas minuta]|uniref:TNF receptor-associated factor 4 isoform X2 n=1 Tax=Oopsacas minuta TaxID=111878 RepID=A0AAV7JMX3_9METZ|nr:TNF receptor-associated factor 4 isoform X2 [Oopsacas minuta]
MAISSADSIPTLCRVQIGEKIGGYRKDLLIENLSERDELFLVCSRCSGILRDACTVSSGEQVCEDCIDEDEQSLPNLQVRNTVIQLKCRCPLSQSGCEWSNEIKHCESHLQTCQFVYVNCQFGCDIVMTRAEEQSHLKETCVLRTVKCEHCGVVCVAGEINEHSGVCEELMVDCDLGCGVRVKREFLGKHLRTECEEGEVTCPYEKYGCDIGEVTRKELRPHLEEKRNTHTELRLNSMEEQIKNQNSLIEYLSTKVAALENHNQILAMKTQDRTNVLVWEIQNMHANLTFQTIIMKAPSSPVLKISRYEMRFGWWVEGDILTVDIFSVLGRDDGELEWPFIANCCIRLICDSDPVNRSLEIKKMIQVKRKSPSILNMPGTRIASVNKAIVLAPGFMRAGVLKIEIRLDGLNTI